MTLAYDMRQDRVETSSREWSGAVPRPRLALMTSDGELAAALTNGYDVTRLGARHLIDAKSALRALAEADAVLLDATGRDIRPLVAALARVEPPPVLVRDAHATAARVREYLEVGADSVAGAGASVREIRARISALSTPVSGFNKREADDSMVIGRVTASVARREVARDGRPLLLTPTEFRLLAALLERPGEVIGGRRLISRVWGLESAASLHSLRTYVYRLRQLLEVDPGRPRALRTELGGYRCIAQPLAHDFERTSSASARTVLLDLAQLDDGPLLTQLGQARFDVVRSGGGDAVAAEAALVGFGALSLERIRFARRSESLGGLPLLALVDDADAKSIARAIESGADDAVAAAAPASEVVARVRALVRLARRRRTRPTLLVRTGDISIDRTARRVRLGGRDVQLSETEYRVLDTLAAQPDRVVSHDELLTSVWGQRYQTETHYLRVYIGYLRSKLEDDCAAPRYLLNERGVGYRLAQLPSTASE